MRNGRLVAALFITCTTLTATATAFAGTIVNQTMPLVTSTFSDCTGELVLVEGNLHVLVREGTSSGGREHVAEAVHFTGVKGTGLVSGARYVEMDVQNTEANITPVGQQEFTAEGTMNLTRLGEDTTFGDGDDMLVHLIAHMTFPLGRQVRGAERVPLN
jgi:hypothetical protein